MPVNHKNTQLVLHSFKRILENMKHESNVLNNFEEIGHVCFGIACLYTDEGGKFKGYFKGF